MGKCMKLCGLLMCLALAFGCASKKGAEEENTQARAQRFIVDFEEDAKADAHHAVKGEKLVSKAHKAIGTPYVMGGTTLDGFDCSGFVRWAYNNVGVELPRTAREQSVIGKKIRNVEDMVAGDIVAFRHPRRGYHTGIYVGDGKFIHSPRKRTRVRINKLSDPYFSSTLLGARRVNLNGGENLVAQAERRLGDFAAEKATRKAAAKKNGKAALLASNGKKAASAASGKKSASKSKASGTRKATQLASASNGKKQAAKGKKTASVAENSKSKKSVSSSKKQNGKQQLAHNGPVKSAKSANRKATQHKAVSILHKSGRNGGKS